MSVYDGYIKMIQRMKMQCLLSRASFSAKFPKKQEAHNELESVIFGVIIRRLHCDWS